MIHHAPQRDGGGAAEDGAVTHGEVTLGLVTLAVSPGQTHTATLGSVPAKFFFKMSLFIIITIMCLIIEFKLRILLSEFRIKNTSVMMLYVSG